VRSRLGELSSSQSVPPLSERNTRPAPTAKLRARTARPLHHEVAGPERILLRGTEQRETTFHNDNFPTSIGLG
jgi:hypothetical protein